MSLLMKAVVKALHFRPKPLASVASVERDVKVARTEAPVPARLKRSHEVAYSQVDGMPVVTLTPKALAPVAELLYMHGGAYLHPIVKQQWDIVDRLTRSTPMRITVPLYALAPEHTGAEAFPTLHRVYDYLTNSGLPLIIAGDSAGAAIAMACTLRARDERRTTPAQVLLFSPWVDASMTNPAIAEIEPHDPMLGSKALVWAAEKWAGDQPISTAWISPLHDSLSDLPPIAVFQGGVDIFAPDAQLFVSKARAAGTQAELHLYPDAFHVFVGVPALPEAAKALKRATELIAAVARG